MLLGPSVVFLIPCRAEHSKWHGRHRDSVDGHRPGSDGAKPGSRRPCRKVVPRQKLSDPKVPSVAFAPHNFLGPASKDRVPINSFDEGRCGLISVGDVLHRIDYQKVEGLSVDEVQGMLSGPVRSSVVLGFVKYRLRLRVNVRLSREVFQPPPRRGSPARAKPTDPYARQETPNRGRPLDNYTTIYASIEQPRAREQQRVLEPRRIPVGYATPRYMPVALRPQQPNIQFSGPYGERLRRPFANMQPFMYSPYGSVAGNFVL